MKYQNGREAKPGDRVQDQSTGEVGIIYELNETAEHSNAKIAKPRTNDHWVTVAHCLHSDDLNNEEIKKQPVPQHDFEPVHPERVPGLQVPDGAGVKDKGQESTDIALNDQGGNTAGTVNDGVGLGVVGTDGNSDGQGTGTEGGQGADGAGTAGGEGTAGTEGGTTGEGAAADGTGPAGTEGADKTGE